MTNENYFKSQLGFGASTGLVEASLLDAGISGSDTYQVSDRETLKKAVLAALYVLLSTPDTDSGTGDSSNSIKYDRALILKRIGVLESELGLAPGAPKIIGRKPW